jgi:hypothetical protein
VYQHLPSQTTGFVSNGSPVAIMTVLISIDNKPKRGTSDQLQSYSELAIGLELVMILQRWLEGRPMNDSQE